MPQSKIPSKSLIVRTYRAEEYKNPSDMFSPNTKLGGGVSNRDLRMGANRSKLEDINEDDETPTRQSVSY